MNHWNTEPEREPQQRPPVDGLAEQRQISLLSLGMLALLAFHLVAQVLAVLLLGSYAEHPAFSLLAGGVCLDAVAQPLSLLIFRGCAVSLPAERRSLRLMELAALLSVSVTLLWLGGVAGSAANSFLTAILGRPIGGHVEEMTAGVPLWAIFAVMVVAAPLCEEWFFRRVLMNRLLRYGEWPAALISGLLFGLIHGNLSQFFYAAALGVFFGLIYARTGRLRYGILLHALINFFGSFYVTWASRLPEELGSMASLGYSVLFFACFAASIPSAILLSKERGHREGEVQWSRREGWLAVRKNPVFWVAAAILLANFILSSVA